MRLFLKNKGMKLLSLVLAVLTWFAVRSMIGQSTAVYTIPVRIETRSGLAVLSRSADSATVVFKGGEEAIAQLEDASVRSQLQVVLKTKARKAPAEETIRLELSDIEGAKDVRAVRINRPAEVRVRLDDEATVEIPVRVVCSGQPASGQLVSAVCDPRSVKVTGPKQAISDIGMLVTEKVDLEFAVDSFETTVPVAVPQGSAALKLEPPSVTVNITIDRGTSTRKFANIPISAVLRPGGPVVTEIRPAAVTVVLYGSARVLDNLQPDAISALVDCGGIEGDKELDLPVAVRNPPGIEAAAVVSPDKVRVVLRGDGK